MPPWRRTIRIAAIASALVAYPLLAHLVAAAPPPAGIGAVAFAVAPLVAVLAIAGWRTPFRLLALGLCAVAAALLWMYAGAIGEHLGLVYFIQNICANAALGVVFGRSLAGGREPLCTHFAVMVRGPLEPPVARYTRQVTVAWTLFFTVMLVASSLLFLLAPIQVWSAFANLLGMPLVAMMFVAEYVARKIVLPDLPRSHIFESLRAYWHSGGLSAPPR